MPARRVEPTTGEPPTRTRPAKRRRAGGRATTAKGAGNGSTHLAELEREVGRTRELKRLVQRLEVYQEEVRRQNDQLMETRRALEQSVARFDELYDHAPVAFLTLDRNGVVVEANRTALSLLHVRREGLMGTPFLFYVSEGDRKGFLNHMTRCRRPPVPASADAEPLAVTVELNVRARSGAVLPVLLSTRPARTEAVRGRLLRMILTDLSNQKAAELQLARYQQQLGAMAAESAMAAERERRRIAVEVHDTLSQSLVLAKMKLAALLKKAKSSGVREDVVQSLAEVTASIEEVLGQTRTLTFELSPPVLYELGFEPALEWLAERMSKRHGLDVAVDGVKQCGAMSEERAVLLFQLVRELVTNAVKHSGAKRIVIRPRCHERHVRITVQDDGHGFDPAARDVLPSTGGGDHGGFGLFSVRTRLEHLGGTLQISSAPGGPTTATVSLPVEST